jgi:uncharacterized BrkB/YihY/UPF0761 family membrane protein
VAPRGVIPAKAAIQEQPQYRLPALDCFAPLAMTWIVMLTALALAVAYRFGPNRVNASWKWLSWGSGTATVLWLIASFGFSWYVSAFNSYGKVYGSIGAVVILLFWFWLAGFSGLLGAELDNAIERRAGIPPARPKKWVKLSLYRKFSERFRTKLMREVY